MNFVGQSVTFVVIDTIGGIEVVGAIVVVVRAVLPVVGTIVEVVRTVIPVVGRRTKWNGLGASGTGK